MQTRSRSWLSWLMILAAVTTGPVAHALDSAAKRIIVVYNENVPESKTLAIYYAEQRGIPKERLCGLRIRNAETIPRPEFNAQIREPLLKFMLDGGLLFQIAQPGSRNNRAETFDNKIDYLVLIYGIPLRIESNPSLKEAVPANLPDRARRDQASVDSELATLPSGTGLLAGWLPNPFFNARATRFAPPLNNSMLLVARLDGPSPATVRREIDDAIATECYGLLGRCYFDARNIKEAGYTDGDVWIKTSYKLMQDAGYECELEDTENLFPEDYPMTDAAVYAGWYTGNVAGPFRRADFQFRPGAIAYHLHSGSAVSVRTSSAYWAGPLLAKGAAVTFGNVYEPYLALTPQLDLFFKRLLDGATFAEAGWYSEPGLSWQTTFVGDPLYRPFAMSVDEQIEQLEFDHHPDLAWAYLRKVNLLLRRSDVADAEELCRRKASELASAILAEKLGDILQTGQRAGDAVAAYLDALTRTGDGYRYYRLALKLAGAYEADGQSAQALAVYEGLAATHTKGNNAKYVLAKAHAVAVAVGDTGKAKNFQDKLDALVAGPSNKKK